MQEYKIRVITDSTIAERVMREPIGLRALADEYQHCYPEQIILAKVNGKLRELSKSVKTDADIEFLTVTSKDGKRTYRRSVTLLLQKAVYDLWSKDVRVRVWCTLGQSFYCELEGAACSEENLAAIAEQMRTLVKQNLPIEKLSVHTCEAEARFASYGMHDKERLLHYRRSSRVNVYRIGGMEDYFYGYMADATGILSVFDIKKYEEGFVICFPDKVGTEVEPFAPSTKLYRTLQASKEWSRMLDMGTVGALNDAIASGRGQEMILLSEALMEERIASIAEQIAGDRRIKFVMIAGPSSSGKTTFSHRLSVQLTAKGLTPHPIGLDDYYMDRDKCPRDENGELDFESLTAIDVEQYNEDMVRLLAGDEVDMPSFNFKTGKREYRGKKLKLGSDDILVIEGIHGLNDKLSYSLPQESKFRIYISALAQLNVDEHNPLSTADGRLIRRIVRDARTRGTTAQETIAMWDNVRRGEEKNIFPFQEGADVMFNSALLYELAVLKVYVEPLLFQIPRDSAEYIEAKRLLKFLDYFLPIPAEGIPQNSLVREFVGGGCFNL